MLSWEAGVARGGVVGEGGAFFGDKATYETNGWSVTATKCRWAINKCMLFSYWSSPMLSWSLITHYWYLAIHITDQLLVADVKFSFCRPEELILRCCERGGSPRRVVSIKQPLPPLPPAYVSNVKINPISPGPFLSFWAWRVGGYKLPIDLEKYSCSFDGTWHVFSTSLA